MQSKAENFAVRAGCKMKHPRSFRPEHPRRRHQQYAAIWTLPILLMITGIGVLHFRARIVSSTEIGIMAIVFFAGVCVGIATGFFNGSRLDIARERSNEILPPFDIASVWPPDSQLSNPSICKDGNQGPEAAMKQTEVTRRDHGTRSE